MPEIHVQFESLQSGQQDIQRNLAALTGTLEQLEADLAPMINSWSGAAQESYLACKKQWDDAAESLAGVLGNIGQAVGQANDNYQSAEQAAQGNWS